MDKQDRNVRFLSLFLCVSVSVEVVVQGAGGAGDSSERLWAVHQSLWRSRCSHQCDSVAPGAQQTRALLLHQLLTGNAMWTQPCGAIHNNNTDFNTLSFSYARSLLSQWMWVGLRWTWIIWRWSWLQTACAVSLTILESSLKTRGRRCPSSAYSSSTWTPASSRA